MSKEYGNVLVRCLGDWWQLWPRLEAMAKSILRKKGVDENDIGDIIGDWRNKLFCHSSKYDAFSYAAKALDRTFVHWKKRKNTFGKFGPLEDFSDFEEEVPSGTEIPEEVIIYREQGGANSRVMQYVRAITILNGDLLDVKIIDTMQAVWEEDITLSVFACCKIAAERLHLSVYTVYRRFLRLCKKMRTQLLSAGLENRLYDDMNLLGLVEYTAAGMAISQPKAAA